MAAPCQLLLLPSELRVSIYREVFHNFILQISDENNFAPYGVQADVAPNQLSKVNKQIRQESIPILASCTKTIVAPILIPYKDRQLDTSIKPQIVRPSLHPAFCSNIHGISISLQSIWVPDHHCFPNLRKIAIDGWLYSPEPVKNRKDKDLVEMSTLDRSNFDFPEEVYPKWLEDLEKEKNESVKLALRQVWRVGDDEDSNESHLVSLEPPFRHRKY